MRSLKEMLLASSWARELSENQLRSVIDGITVRTIPTGGYVCMKGEPVEYWMGILDGLVKMASIWSTGMHNTTTPRPASSPRSGSAR